MARLCIAVVLAIGGPLLLFSEGDASSLIQEQLATVSEVQVVVASGGMSYEPLPGFEKEAFKKKVAGEVSLELEKCGISSVESSPQRLVISLSKTSRNPEVGDFIALELGIELQEPAVLLRSWTVDGNPDSLVVTSWLEWDSFVSSPDESLDRMVEAVVLLTQKFAQKTAQARDSRTVEGQTGMQEESVNLPDCLD